MKRIILNGLLGIVVLSASGCTYSISDPSMVKGAKAVDEAQVVGQKVLAIQEALRSPHHKDALGVILALGQDQRYYTMVRGWLGYRLMADLSIRDANPGNISPELAARINLLQKAIRRIDLE